MDATEDTNYAIAQITKQATTGTPVTPGPDGWVDALPQLDDVACEWQMKDSLLNSHLWFEDGDYYATNLPSGLEDREDTPLSRNEAVALLEGGLSHSPVDLSEVDR